MGGVCCLGLDLVEAIEDVTNQTHHGEDSDMYKAHCDTICAGNHFLLLQSLSVQINHV